MAISSKFMPVPHLPDSINPPCNNSQTPRTHFLSPLNQTHHLFLRKSQRFSVISNTSIDCSTNFSSQITELCVKGSLHEALKLLDSVRELKLFIEDDVFLSLLNLCEWKRAPHEGQRVYSHICNSRTRLDIRVGNALLSMFVRFRNLGDAWYVFGKMEERDLFSWNVLVGGYAKAGFFNEALDLYHRMLWVGLMSILFPVY
ncbi:LOW QUALITY PROTEIN: hypothetical protein Cgig2_024532 [Carnegiea gigantea]|uniref:Pentatricopeptide repeat-containing protein n=1 Tax=Carnegiea gigantea TaxID=171969 RepID=A0A9Q1JXE9_9CARY|nr:LOW QUALITY PROTEIN: hypothetical protein Cgig2_024532 [Carnegiea gigantea]